MQWLGSSAPAVVGLLADREPAADRRPALADANSTSLNLWMIWSAVYRFLAISCSFEHAQILRFSLKIRTPFLGAGQSNLSDAESSSGTSITIRRIYSGIAITIRRIYLLQ